MEKDRELGCVSLIYTTDISWEKAGKMYYIKKYLYTNTQLALNKIIQMTWSFYQTWIETGSTSITTLRRGIQSAGEEEGGLGQW